MLPNYAYIGKGHLRPGASLRNALFFYVLLPIALVSAVGFWWSLRAFERQVEIRMQKDLEMVARAIKRPLSHALLREREGSIAEALKSAFAMSHVYGAYLYDAEGRKISDTTITAKQEQPIDRREVSERAEEGKRHGQYTEMGGRDVYSYFVPLTDSGGKITGLLQLTRRYSDFEAQIKKIRYRGTVIFLISMILLTGTILYGHHRVFGRHLQRFAESMSTIAAGNYQHRYTTGGPVDFVRLGRNFNRMMDHIQRAEEEIKQHSLKQRKLEKRLRQAEKMAAVGELAAGVAHELGTPLSLIDAGTQRAQRKCQPLSETSKAMQQVRHEAQRMTNIIRQLLDFSRRSKIERRPVKTGNLVKAAVSALNAEITASGTEIKSSGLSSITINVDPLRTEQALINLLRNAVQAAPGGLVSIDCCKNDGAVVFTVTDDGEGVATVNHDKLFEPFFTTKPVGKGTGLGLAVVHGIAEEHGGKIEFDQTYKNGACFRLYLPDEISSKEYSAL